MKAALCAAFSFYPPFHRLKGKEVTPLLIIALRRLKARLAAALIAVVILLALCYGMPRFYDFLAKNDEDFKKLDDPVRVEAFPDTETRAMWLRIFGN